MFDVVFELLEVVEGDAGFEAGEDGVVVEEGFGGINGVLAAGGVEELG